MLDDYLKCVMYIGSGKSGNGLFIKPFEIQLLIEGKNIGGKVRGNVVGYTADYEEHNDKRDVEKTGIMFPRCDCMTFKAPMCSFAPCHGYRDLRDGFILKYWNFIRTEEERISIEKPAPIYLVCDDYYWDDTETLILENSYEMWKIINNLPVDRVAVTME